MSEAALRHGVVILRDVIGPDGQLWIGGFHPLAGRPLAVVTQVPHARVYASLRSTRRVVYFALAGALALAVVAAILFARGLVRPVGRLVELAGDLAARRFDRPADVRTRDELSILGSALNAAAAELRVGDERIAKEASIRADLGRFLPAELVDKVIRREHHMALGGARRPITALFADVVGFTPMAEGRRPEDMVQMLNELFTILTEIVVKHGGLVDKLIGDCLMALWGAVDGMPGEPRDAVEAALEMQRWLEVGRASWRDRYGVDVHLAIGISSGEAIVGNIGSDRQMQFTAIGEVVNVAAKVELVARPDQVLITAPTRAALGDDPPCVAIDAKAPGDVALYEVRQ
jgi:class 3 adenylate cyclase